MRLFIIGGILVTVLLKENVAKPTESSEVGFLNELEENAKNEDKEEWAEFANTGADDAIKIFEQKYEKPNASNKTKSKSGRIQLEATPAAKPRKLFGSIKIKGRGNVVVYLVRPTPSKAPGIAPPPTAAKISVQKSTPVSFLAKLFNLAKPEEPAPEKTILQKIKATTKKIVAKKSVKVSTKKQIKVTLQGKRATLRVTTKKVATQKKTTKRKSKKIIVTTTTPEQEVTTSVEEVEELRTTVTAADIDFEEDTIETKKVTTSSIEPKTIKTTTEVGDASLLELEESSAAASVKTTALLTTLFKFVPPTFFIPNLPPATAATPFFFVPPVIFTPPPFIPPVIFTPPPFIPPVIFTPPPFIPPPVFMAPSPVIFTPPPFVAPPVFTPPPFIPPAAPFFPPPAAAAPFTPAAPHPTVAPTPVFKQPWMPPAAVPHFAAAAVTKSTAPQITETTTEFATVDIDSLIEEAEGETTPKPNDDMNAFGGLDIGNMVGGFLGGFSTSTGAKDHAAGASASKGIE